MLPAFLENGYTGCVGSSLYPPPYLTYKNPSPAKAILVKFSGLSTWYELISLSHLIDIPTFKQYLIERIEKHISGSVRTGSRIMATARLEISACWVDVGDDGRPATTGLNYADYDTLGQLLRLMEQRGWRDYLSVVVGDHAEIGARNVYRAPTRSRGKVVCGVGELAGWQRWLG